MANIAFIDVTATVSYGGVQTAIWQLAKALHDLGHRVTVFGGEGNIRPDLAGRQIDIQTFPFTPRQRAPKLGSRFQKLFERFTFALHARKAVIAAEFDWVVLTKPLDFFWPWLGLPQPAPRFALMSGGTDFLAGDRWLARRIGAWLACSHFNAWQIAGRYKRFPVVMFNGVDLEQFSPHAADPAARQELGATPEDVLFAYAGRVVGWKGLATALHALAHPVMRPVPARLAIIGDGPQRAELKRLADDLGIADRVIFHPAVPHAELPRLYAAMDAGVFPSIGDEAFGITIAEAMSCGKPVIASHIGGIPEVVGNEGSCGILVAPGNATALAEAMAALASDSVLRARLGEAARARIAQLFSWRQAAQRLLRGLELPSGDSSR